MQEVPAAAFADCDPHGESFSNINTPQEYFALRDGGRDERTAVAPPSPQRRRA